MSVSIIQSPRFFLGKKRIDSLFLFYTAYPTILFVFFCILILTPRTKVFLEIENKIFKKIICNICNKSGVFHYQKFFSYSKLDIVGNSNRAFQWKKEKVRIRKWGDSDLSWLYKNFNIWIEGSYCKTYLILSIVMLELFFVESIINLSRTVLKISSKTYSGLPNKR